MTNLIYVSHIFTCFFMTGLIWLIQLIHYPSYRFIDFNKFPDFQRFHTFVITFIVGPIMTVEVFSGLYILIYEGSTFRSAINFLGLVGIWLSTAILSVPSHNKLNKEFNLETVSFLVRTNWIRTIFWTLRSALIFYCMISAIEASNSRII